MHPAIKFGTSGWRGIIARDFTFDNLRVATQGIADYLNSQSKIGGSKQIIIGHDTRFLGREFSLAAAEVLAVSGFEPLLCERDAPTPVIAHTIRHRRAIGGINMTASHNPAEYQGLKFSTSNGAPSTPEVTKVIEANIAHTIRHRRAIGGINMTASHNPAEYQGLKFSTSNGAPSPFVSYQGLPADWYLRLTAEGSKVISGECPNTATIPISP